MNKITHFDIDLIDERKFTQEKFASNRQKNITYNFDDMKSLYRKHEHTSGTVKCDWNRKTRCLPMTQSM